MFSSRAMPISNVMTTRTKDIPAPMLGTATTTTQSSQVTLLAPTGALIVAPLPLFHITSSRSSKSLYNLLTLLKNLEHLCLHIYI